MPLIVGKSAAIRNLLVIIKKSANSESSVLILGETGVGKELAAKAIHTMSSKMGKPFVKLNCGNLNENLIESELFGHKKGAYTGAFFDRPGLIEAARGGTFFFDEIGDISLGLQAKLLSVIEDKEIRRIGENNRRKIDLRFIFATNKDLFALAAKKKFRDDLFYRINILTVDIAPLRDRKEDIPLLIEHILSIESRRTSTRKKIMSPKAMDRLLNYGFPGNIRELENIVIRASIFSDNSLIKEANILIPDQMTPTNLDIANKLYLEITKTKKSYWDAVHKPFINRELNRREVMSLIELGLKQTNNSYKKLLPLLNLGEEHKEYKRFMKVIRVHNLSRKHAQ